MVVFVALAVAAGAVSAAASALAVAQGSAAVSDSIVASVSALAMAMSWHAARAMLGLGPTFDEAQIGLCNVSQVASGKRAKMNLQSETNGLHNSLQRFCAGI